MSTLQRMRRLFRLALAFMLLLSALAALALLTPWVGSRRAYQEQYDQLRPQLQASLREAAPLENIEDKVERARRDAARFFDQRLPAQASAIAERFGSLAALSGVRIVQVRYLTEETGIPGLQRVRIEAGLAGDYLEVVRFVNALERDQMFFLVDALSLAEQQGGAVRIELTVETFLRSPDAPSQPQAPPSAPEPAAS